MEKPILTNSTSDLKCPETYPETCPGTRTITQQNGRCVQRSAKTSVHWQRLFTSFAFWLLAEIFLGALGLDDMADYSEFLGNRHAGYSHLRPHTQKSIDDLIDP